MDEISREINSDFACLNLNPAFAPAKNAADAALWGPIIKEAQKPRSGNKSSPIIVVSKLRRFSLLFAPRFPVMSKSFPVNFSQTFR